MPVPALQTLAIEPAANALYRQICVFFLDFIEQKRSLPWDATAPEFFKNPEKVLMLYRKTGLSQLCDQKNRIITSLNFSSRIQTKLAQCLINNSTSLLTNVQSYYPIVDSKVIIMYNYFLWMLMKYIITPAVSSLSFFGVEHGLLRFINNHLEGDCDCVLPLEVFLTIALFEPIEHGKLRWLRQFYSGHLIHDVLLYHLARYCPDLEGLYLRCQPLCICEHTPEEKFYPPVMSVIYGEDVFYKTCNPGLQGFEYLTTLHLPQGTENKDVVVSIVTEIVYECHFLVDIIGVPMLLVMKKILTDIVKAHGCSIQLIDYSDLDLIEGIKKDITDRYSLKLKHFCHIAKEETEIDNALIELIHTFGTTFFPNINHLTIFDRDDVEFLLLEVFHKNIINLELGNFLPQYDKFVNVSKLKFVYRTRNFWGVVEKLASLNKLTHLIIVNEPTMMTPTFQSKVMPLYIDKFICLAYLERLEISGCMPHFFPHLLLPNAKQIRISFDDDCILKNFNIIRRHFQERCPQLESFDNEVQRCCVTFRLEDLLTEYHEVKTITPSQLSNPAENCEAIGLYFDNW